MSWDDLQGEGSAITYGEWNIMTPYIKSVISAGSTIKIGAGPSITAISSGSDLGTSDVTLVTQNAIKTYVDAQITAEDFWDRTGTSITPATANDNLAIGSGSIVTTSGLSDGTTAVTIDDTGSAITHSELQTGNPHTVLATQIYDFDTQVQANGSVVLNTAKTSYDDSLVYANGSVAANTAKIGYSEDLVYANGSVVLNSAKVSYDDSLVYANGSVAANTAKTGYTETLVYANGSVVANTAKVGYTETLVNANGSVVANSGSVISNAAEIATKTDLNIGIYTQTADYELTAGENGSVLHMNATGSVVLPDGLDTGYNQVIVNIGTGSTVSIVATTTLNSKDSGSTMATQYGAVSVYHAGSNVWYAYGDLS